MCDFTKLLKDSPTVLVDIIFGYIANDKTRYCDECKEITNLEDWLDDEETTIHKTKHISISKTIDVERCPNCYTKCDNDSCEEIFDNGNIYQIFVDGENVNLCRECMDTETFYCDLHREHKLLTREEERICVDCDKSYCDVCYYDEDITYCESCNDYSCCRKFIRIKKYGRDEFCDKCVEG